MNRNDMKDKAQVNQPLNERMNRGNDNKRTSINLRNESIDEWITESINQPSNDLRNESIEERMNQPTNFNTSRS